MDKVSSGYNDGILQVKSQYINSLTLFDVVYACMNDNGTISSKDGSLFRGRGYIQLTGRVNYKSKFYDPWIALHPEEKRSIETMAPLLAEDKEIAMQASMAFFKTNCISYIKTSGDVIEEEIRKVSVAVNGGDVKTKALSSVEQGSVRKSNTEKSYKVLK